MVYFNKPTLFEFSHFLREAMWIVVDLGVRVGGSSSLKENSIFVIAIYKSKDSFPSSKFVSFKVLTEVNCIAKEAKIKTIEKQLICTIIVE